MGIVKRVKYGGVDKDWNIKFNLNEKKVYLLVKLTKNAVYRNIITMPLEMHLIGTVCLLLNCCKTGKSTVRDTPDQVYHVPFLYFFMRSYYIFNSYFNGASLTFFTGIAP